MISFGYNVHFADEPQIDDGRSDTSFPLIPVIHASNTSFTERAIYTTPPINLAEQEVRFFSLVAFNAIKSGDSWAMEVTGRLRLFWDGKKRLITYEKSAGYTPEYLRYWVLHTFLPLLLQLESRYHLIHAGCVDIDGSAVLFCAPSYGGKSTLVDYFLQRSHPLICDDSLGVEVEDDNYYAISSYPFHRPYRQPESLGEYCYDFVTHKEKIKAVYSLTEVPADADVRIRKLKGIEKFRRFGTNAFVKFRFLERTNFEFLSKMAHSLDIYSIAVPRDTGRLPEVYKAIMAHQKRYYPAHRREA